MGFTLESSVSAAAVFLQGLFSFFSPCVLPLVPLYVGYLAGGAKEKDADGKIYYPRKRVLINTIFFVLGVSFAFFLLGFGFTAAGQFFSGNRLLFARIGGVLVILFGLYQLGVFRSKTLSSEHRLPFRLDKLSMNPFTALLFGFTFSFAWTPCVGPALAGVLVMASSASTASTGYLLIGVYTIGFILPFLAVGLFTGTLLDLFRKYNKVVVYTVKAGGVLMIFMGLMMTTGWMNGITGYLADTVSGVSGTQEETSAQEERPEIPAPDFTLTDQNGQTHTLSDYKGKTVFLNFWATWCGPCKSEMPDIQKLYEAYGENQEDLIVLGVVQPNNDELPFSQEGTEDEIREFIDQGGYTYPTVMDETGEISAMYGITAFPTTFMIDKDGNVYGYVMSALPYDIMESIVQQTMEGRPAE